MKPLRCVLTLLVACAACVALSAASAGYDAAWNKPVEPFRIIGNIYYIGTNELASYLVTSQAGHVIVDGGFEETAPMMLEHVRALGFTPTDVKVLLTTQAHFDHVASLHALKDATGARVMVMDGDAPLVERGGRGDFAFGDQYTFPAVPVDRVLHDGDTVRVGDTTLTAHLTAGHTRGCTTWTTTVQDGGRSYDVVFAGSLTVNPPVHLVKNPSYPGIANDYRRSLDTMRGLRADVFLGAHTGFFDLTGKRDRLKAGEQPNPFIDPAGYRAYLARMAKALDERIESERR